MKILKSIIILFLLVVITCGVVFAPQITSGQKEENILNKVIHRSYSTGDRPKLTSEQVARLYYNREISVQQNSLPINIENNEKTRKTIITFIESLFGKNEIIYKQIEELLNEDYISYSRGSCLIKIDNQPAALNFIKYSIENDDVFFEIIYEEKTKTIIGFACDMLQKQFENRKQIDFFAETTIETIKKYYEEELLFKQDEYFCFIDFPIIYVGNENDLCLANIYIGCGLMQYDDKPLYEESETFIIN